MTPKILGRLAAAALACFFICGCRSDFRLLLFNNTEDPVVLHRRADDPTPLVVLAGVAGEITGVSTDDFFIMRQGKPLHYRFPAAYTYPSAAVPPGYQHRVPHIGRVFYFQLAPDNRIYILRPDEPLSESGPAPQPAGFPLVPR
jgi:hypothetical protein